MRRIEREIAEKDKVGGVKQQQQACKERAKEWSKNHGKKPSSCSPTDSRPLSFFKIMLGDFKEVMFIPPKFAPTLKGLINQIVFLEDSNGNSSTVRISEIDGSLALQQGWDEFVSDHFIETGELVVFNYISTSLFSVQIFGICACERVRFHEGKNRNTLQKNGNAAELHFTKKRRRSASSKDKCNPVNEVPVKEEQDIRHDPSDLPKSKVNERGCANGGESKNRNKPKKCPDSYCGSKKPAAAVATNAPESRLNPIAFCVTEKVSSISCHDKVVMPSEAFWQCGNISNIPCSAHTIDCRKNEHGNVLSVCKEMSKDHHFEKTLGSSGIPPPTVCLDEDAPTIGTTGNFPQGALPDIFPEEDEKEITPCLQEKTFEDAVRIEPKDQDISMPSPACFSFRATPNDKSWLELPQGLPSCMGKKRYERKVITLRDPSMRLWPVLYHESFQFKGFTSGWKGFATANNLGLGDLCEISEVATEWEPTFHVQISKL